MKATITLLTALLVSTISFNTTRAQDSIQPVGFGGKVVSGGCADGSCGGGGGEAHLFGKKAHNGACQKGCGHRCAILDHICGWWKRSLPSDAPSCRRPDYPLGFPNSPYLRSPRDYFMDP